MTRGGYRKGSGRPTGTGRWGETTKPVRVPESKIDAVKAFIARGEEFPTLPLFTSQIPAGSPSPTDDHIDANINLHDHLVHSPENTFFLRAKGESMINAGIFDGDIMVIDQSISPRHGNIVIAGINGDLTVKRLEHLGPNNLRLMPENPNYEPIEIPEDADFRLWGVVTSVIHQF